MDTASGDLTDFSRHLKKLRQESGLSQEALAELIGTSNTTICRYETGRQAPTRFHRAMLAEVFGVPGYSLFEDDYVPKAFLPDVTIRTQERLRHAMCTGDFEYIDELIYRLHISLAGEYKKASIVQARNYLRCWSFFNQGVSAKNTLSDMIGCIRITRPAFSVDEVCRDGTLGEHLTYTELSIINSIGVMLIHTGDYSSSARLFALLIGETDDPMLATERRFCQKCVLGLNMSIALRRLGQAHKARRLLALYCRDAYLYGTAAICMRLLIGVRKCAEPGSTEYTDDKYNTGFFHKILMSKFGLKTSLSELERECDEGIMVL